MECRDVQVMEQDDQGNITFISGDYSIAIHDSADGKRGLAAVLTTKDGQSFTDLDVRIDMIPAKDAENVKELASVLAPSINWSDVANVRAGTIRVEANEQDASGMTIFEIQDAQGTVLSRLTQIGWGFGKCSN